ncbi:MAG: response regulator transcription factor [Bryobacteraceae bacterium]|nr:response regulator transcription factor [Bryobacteraceae bacterium]
MEVGGEDADVILADADLPEAGTGLPIVLLSDSPEWTTELLREGVRAILPDLARQEEIAAALQAAAAGFAILAPGELEQLLPEPTAPAEPLSARENEVLRMLADGHANKEIAYRLGISEHTVKFHVASILAKLGAGTRTEAVRLGIRRGLVPL